MKKEIMRDKWNCWSGFSHCLKWQWERRIISVSFQRHVTLAFVITGDRVVISTDCLLISLHNWGSKDYLCILERQVHLPFFNMWLECFSKGGSNNHLHTHTLTRLEGCQTCHFYHSFFNLFFSKICICIVFQKIFSVLDILFYFNISETLWEICSGWFLVFTVHWVRQRERITITLIIKLSGDAPYSTVIHVNREVYKKPLHIVRK